MDLGVYGIQFACLIFNNEMPRTVQAAGCLNEEGVDQSVSTTFLYDGNRTATVVTHSLVDLQNEAYVIGTKGVIKVPNFWCPTTIELPSGKINVSLPRTESKFNFINGVGLSYEANEVRNCILAGIEALILNLKYRSNTNFNVFYSNEQTIDRCNYTRYVSHFFRNVRKFSR